MLATFILQAPLAVLVEEPKDPLPNQQNNK